MQISIMNRLLQIGGLTKKRKKDFALSQSQSQKDLVVMMATMSPAGVPPEMNLRNPLHTGEKACKWDIHPGFGIQDKDDQKSIIGSQ